MSGNELLEWRLLLGDQGESAEIESPLSGDDELASRLTAMFGDGS